MARGDGIGGLLFHFIFILTKDIFFFIAFRERRKENTDATGKHLSVASYTRQTGAQTSNLGVF